MNHRRAPGRIRGLSTTRSARLLLILVLTGLGPVAARPVGAAIGPIGFGDPSAEARPENAGSFPAQRLGTRSEPHTFRIRNTSPLPISMGDVTLEALSESEAYGNDGESGRKAFSVTTDCPGAVLLPEAACEVAVTFSPLRTGASGALLRITHDGDSRQAVQRLLGHGTLGLYQAGAFGEVFPYGDAKTHGDLSHVAITSPVLGIATTPTGGGYWLMEAAGRVHPFGDAAVLASPVLPGAEYAVALEATATGQGYWIATHAGGIHAIGDAGFFGSAAGRLGQDVDVVDVAASPTGKGYWLLDSVGGVHTFGDAGFFGSAAALPPRYPVTGIAPTASGKGYWLLDALGGVFAYGDAQAFQPDNTTTAYGVEAALQDAVISVEGVPYGQGFVYGRLRGGFGARGVDLSFSSPGYGYSAYGGAGFQPGSFAVDLAFNVPLLHPAPEAGTVIRSGQPGLRSPEQFCAVVACGAAPAPPAPPAVPAPPALPALPVSSPWF